MNQKRKRRVGVFDEAEEIYIQSQSGMTSWLSFFPLEHPGDSDSH